MKILSIYLLGTIMLLCAPAAKAVTIEFDLLGNAGAGLLPGNENPAVTDGGTGGEIGLGIFFDTDTNLLTINVAWGSANGFTDLSGDVTIMHIHGPTTSAAPDSFTENAGILIDLHTLTGFNASGSSGGLSDSVTIPTENVPDLFSGRLYINAHTDLNPGGEIRGQLIPEPSLASLLVVGAAGLFLRRRR